MPVRWPCGSRRKSVFALCNCREIMCMDLKPLINLFIEPFYNEICIALTENILNYKRNPSVTFLGNSEKIINK